MRREESACQIAHFQDVTDWISGWRQVQKRLVCQPDRTERWSCPSREQRKPTHPHGTALLEWIPSGFGRVPIGLPIACLRWWFFFFTIRIRLSRPASQQTGASVCWGRKRWASRLGRAPRHRLLYSYCTKSLAFSWRAGSMEGWWWYRPGRAEWLGRARPRSLPLSLNFTRQGIENGAYLGIPRHEYCRPRMAQIKK